MEKCFGNCDSKINGELYLFNTIKDHICIIFDVGCRTDSLFLEFKGEVHYFDPDPLFIEIIKKKKKINSKSFCNIFGLSEKEEKLLYYPNCQSFINRKLNLYSKEGPKILQVKTGKDYVIDNCIKKIGFLKIDTEGFELEVLKGFENYLSIINIVQFEWGDINKNINLTDIIEYLENNNFKNFSYLCGNKLHPVIKEDIPKGPFFCNIVCFNNLFDNSVFFNKLNLT